jgi:hypothetical protein
LRDGLSRAALGASVHIHPLFAEAGDTVLDHTEGVNAELPQRITTAYLNGNPCRGKRSSSTFWRRFVRRRPSRRSTPSFARWVGAFGCGRGSGRALAPLPALSWRPHVGPRRTYIAAALQP